MTVDVENGETFLKGNENRKTYADGTVHERCTAFHPAYAIEMIAIER